MLASFPAPTLRLGDTPSLRFPACAPRSKCSEPGLRQDKYSLNILAAFIAHRTTYGKPITTAESIGLQESAPKGKLVIVAETKSHQMKEWKWQDVGTVIEVPTLSGQMRYKLPPHQPILFLSISLEFELWVKLSSFSVHPHRRPAQHDAVWDLTRLEAVVTQVTQMRYLTEYLRTHSLMFLTLVLGVKSLRGGAQTRMREPSLYVHRHPVLDGFRFFRILLASDLASGPLTSGLLIRRHGVEAPVGNREKSSKIIKPRSPFGLAETELR
ncbi:hypothetical protein C8F04DRAFT_1234762 [Mycena alexandri]|uniref:Uncharacterized protein n=1 Tax=Mycena alexandri TaxID=1745969 RepID=A0AAD6WZS9_9AGAR|nr:hypothetical protein C8F04DRAFT_1234762 [Mycena alexandri]